MKKSRIARPIAAVESPTVRTLPLVELLVDTKTELMELMVRSGLRVLDAMLDWAVTNDAWETRRLKALEPRFQDSEIKELLRERIYAHVLPSLTQARTVAWDKLKYITRDIPDTKKNESTLSIRFPGPKASNRLVQLFGADNIDALIHASVRTDGDQA